MVEPRSIETEPRIGTQPATHLPDIEAWAQHYVLSTDLRVKLAPPAVPDRFRQGATPLRLEAPGRPPQLKTARRGERTPKAEALKEPYHRARLLHAFWHHELQAAELMCWAVLAFADAEPEFRRGLIGICLDEIRHMNQYRQHIEFLGSRLGDFGVRDWFWRRVPSCSSKVAFVALMGMGLEAANLEYASSFAAQLRAAGDEQAATIQEQIGREELAHVRFGTRWFTRWTGGCRFDEWNSHLPPPLSPWVLKSHPLATQARLSAGMPPDFLARLEAYLPEPKGRPVPAPAEPPPIPSSTGTESRSTREPGIDSGRTGAPAIPLLLESAPIACSAARWSPSACPQTLSATDLRDLSSEIPPAGAVIPADPQPPVTPADPLSAEVARPGLQPPVAPAAPLSAEVARPGAPSIGEARTCASVIESTPADRNPSDARRFAWVLNLDAEFELARPSGYTPRARLLSQLEQYGSASRQLLGPNDLLIRPQVRIDPTQEPRSLIGRAWCPTPLALAAMRAAGIQPEPHPDPAVLRRVNHRHFAFQLGGGLPGQRYLEDRESIENEIRRAPGPLLLKRPLAFAGRGQLRVYGNSTIPAKDWAWIDASLRVDGLIVEPLVVPLAEFSLHGFLWRDGQYQLGHLCVQSVSDRGVYRGVRRAEPADLEPSELHAFVEQGQCVAAALADAGYFGPFGIDGYRYQLEQRTALCTLSEINARYTMGFLTGFPHHPSNLVL